MAYNKEAIVIILDVGSVSTQVLDGSSSTFLEKEKECCIKLLQKKIFDAKKDELALVLMGTEETQNHCAAELDGHENICEAFSLAVPNWDLVRVVNRCESNGHQQASWEEALVVAIDLLKRETKNKKFGALKILLFTSFASVGKGRVEASGIVDDLKIMEIELIVVSDNIEFGLDNGGNENATPSQATFTQVPGKSATQTKAEQVILQIIEDVDGNLTSFDYLIEHLSVFQRKKARPSYWYATLEIGKDLHMEVAATILIKREQQFKFTTVANDDNMVLSLETEYFKNGEKIDLAAEDIIKGYMLGSTPIPYDETLGAKKIDTKKGLRCLAFTKSSTIPPQMVCGNGTYLVIAREGDGRSQKLFRLLVKAMDKNDYAMIGVRVYLNGHKPKLQMLTPNLTTSVPALNMYELVYADQIHYWYFPLLCTKKSQPSAEQYQAVDELIDAMDLMDAGEDGKEAFPFDSLVNPAVQNLYDCVTKRAIDPQFKVEVFDGRVEEALKIPELITQRCAEPRKKIKQLFSLEEPKPMKKELVRKLCLIPDESSDGPLALGADEAMEDTKKIIEVGTVNPEEDFKTLLNQDMDAFPKVSEQLGNVLYDLIFKSMTDQTEKVCDAMTTFREFAKFYGPYVYSDWMRTIKETVVTRRKLEFWENVVVKNHLGLIAPSESEKVVSVSDEEAEEFYRLNVGGDRQTGGQDEEADVDDLFGQM